MKGLSASKASPKLSNDASDPLQQMEFVTSEDAPRRTPGADRPIHPKNAGQLLKRERYD